jgi:hypothetical protein
MAAKNGEGEPGPAFPADPEDAPRLSVELLMSQLVDQASMIMTAQQRLRQLLIANRSIVQELSLPAVLRRIVNTAKDLSRSSCMRAWTRILSEQSVGLYRNLATICPEAAACLEH